MTEQFNLSEKIRKDDESYLWTEGVIDMEDVKEFIKLLKEELHGMFDDEINQLAGDKLI